jgi:hypothetical protein
MPKARLTPTATGVSEKCVGVASPLENLGVSHLGGRPVQTSRAPFQDGRKIERQQFMSSLKRKLLDLDNTF